MRNTTDIKVGGEVRVLTHNRYRKFPEGGYQGTVIKVGRKYATAEYEVTAMFMGREETFRRTIEFDMADGEERGSSYRSGDYARTPRQLERDERRNKALLLLKDKGVELNFRRENSLALDQIESLAEVVKSWDA